MQLLTEAVLFLLLITIPQQLLAATQHSFQGRKTDSSSNSKKGDTVHSAAGQRRSKSVAFAEVQRAVVEEQDEPTIAAAAAGIRISRTGEIEI